MSDNENVPWVCIHPHKERGPYIILVDRHVKNIINYYGKIDIPKKIHVHKLSVGTASRREDDIAQTANRRCGLKCKPKEEINKKMEIKKARGQSEVTPKTLKNLRVYITKISHQGERLH